MLQEIHVDQLKPSPTNPRKTFDDDKLQELAKSIREVGVLEPLIVRAHQNGGPPSYEIVAGERRYRASVVAGVLTVPCMVRELTDVQVLEIQAIENLQRDDVHPLEEADGYAALIAAGGYDEPEIAERIGKSTKYVYDRLKLRSLCPELRAIFIANEMTAGHAILLARLTPAEQLEALGDPEDEYFDGGLFTVDYDDDQLDLDPDAKPARLLKSVRELGNWIRSNIRLRPDDAEIPTLFPEMAAALEEATESKLQVVHISRGYQGDDAEGAERLYNRNQWKRADGEEDEQDFQKSKKCELSVLGVVVLGSGQGQAFKVCVDRKCPVHWKKEKAAGKSKSRNSSVQSWEKKMAKERAEREAREARWKKALPTIRERTIERIRKAPIAQVADLVLEACAGHRGVRKIGDLTRGKTAEDAIRFAAGVYLSNNALSEYSSYHGPDHLKKIGVDAGKILDEVAPKPKPEKPANAKPAAKKKAAKKKAKA